MKKQILKKALTNDHFQVVLLHLCDETDFADSSPLNSECRQSLCLPLFTYTFHHTVSQSVVGLSRIASSTRHTGEYDKVPEVRTHLAGQSVQVLCGHCFRLSRYLKIFFSLIFKYCVSQNL